MHTWIISVETEKDVLSVDTCNSVQEYLPYLFRVARLVDEVIPRAFIRVLTPRMRGVFGTSHGWKKEDSCLIFNGETLKDLANAARVAGFEYR